MLTPHTEAGAEPVAPGMAPRLPGADATGTTGTACLPQIDLQADAVEFAGKPLGAAEHAPVRASGGWLIDRLACCGPRRASGGGRVVRPAPRRWPPGDPTGQTRLTFPAWT